MSGNEGARTGELERRYRRLLWAYPSAYRRDRGAELVGTYLDLASEGRRRPSLADAADLVGGGLRERLRVAGTAGLLSGVRLAAVLAFPTAAALAAGWSVLEAHPPAPEFQLRTFGPFASLGVVAWAAWLVAAVTHALAPARHARSLIGLAVLLTALVVPAAALTGAPRPPLSVLVPQLALGLLALALPDRLPLWVRLTPAAVAALAAVLAVRRLAPEDGYVSYHSFALGSLGAVGGALLIVALALALALALRRDTRGAWALLVLLTPAGLLSVRELAEQFVGRNPYWAALASIAAAVTLLGPALVLFALAARRGRPLSGRSGGCCPTCGAAR
ncbi:hypothetical protein ACH4T9_11910 [Micromonospora sp. NPDC020750]|uniref:hypothetical protein n=1 Tax=unclassified Micromonospora TaxID=2617518 RepID=UPI00378A99FE